MNAQPTLFVSIASYRDEELIPTLRNMIQEARHPERLHIAVCWQDDNDLSPFLTQGFKLQSSDEYRGFALHRLQRDHAVVNLLAVHYHQSQGACWARHLAGSLWQQQDYFLQIDSHCRFIPHWDSAMIEMLESIKPRSPHPVLTHYPPAYVPGEDEQRAPQVCRLVFNHFNTNGSIAQQSVQMEETQPRRSGYLAAGFIFAEGHFAQRVPYDPELFFIGEEITLAARAWTTGYDFYTPHQVLLWHYYGRSDAPKHWSDHNTKALDQGLVEKTWWQRDEISQLRLRSLLGISDEPVDLGRYGLGSQRTLEEFQYRLGLDFRHQRVHPDVTATQRVTWFEDLPDSAESWQQSLQSENQRLWNLKKSEIDFDRPGVLWWQLGVYQQDNTPLMNQQLAPAEIAKLTRSLNDDEIELKVHFITPYAASAHSIRLCPYLEDEGWGEIKERTW